MASDIILFSWIILSLAGAAVIGLLTKKYGAWIGISAIASLAVISNVLASAKVVVFPFGLSAPAGILAYMMSFFLMDVLNEFYGPKTAKQGVYAGVIAQLITVPLIWLMLSWPAAPFVPAEKVAAANMALGLSPQLFGAAIVAFAVSALLNVALFAAIRKRTGDAMLWLRNKGSTITAIFVSNLIFIPLGYYGTGFPITKMIGGHSAVQVIIALIDTAFIYLVVHFAKTKAWNERNS